MSETKTTIISTEDKDALASFKTWTKALSIFNYVYAGFMILVAVLSILTIIGPIMYGLLAWAYIWFGNKLRLAAKSASEISEDLSLEEYKEKSMSLIKQLQSYFKVQGILTIVGTVLTVIFLIFYTIFFVALFSSMQNGTMPTNNSRYNQPTLFDTKQIK